MFRLVKFQTAAAKYGAGLLALMLLAGCSMPVAPPGPRRWTMASSIILEVPGEGGYFPPQAGIPAIIVVRNINDQLVVPHEAGHAIWDATGQPQQYK